MKESRKIKRSLKKDYNKHILKYIKQYKFVWNSSVEVIVLKKCLKYRRYCYLNNTRNHELGIVFDVLYYEKSRKEFLSKG